MKRILMFAALSSCALSLAACTTQGLTSAGSVSATAETVDMDSTRGLILAELAYQPLAQAALSALQNGVIKGGAAQTVRDLNAKITAGFIAAKAATTAVDRAAQVKSLNDAILALQSLVPMEK